MIDLYYETHGDSGPVLLLIPGGNGDAGPYAPVARALAGRFRVITYDRRGFSRSALGGPIPADRLAVDVEDAIALLNRAGVERAHIFGSSSGAIVGLRLIETHPDRVRTLIAHEPPLISLLPDRAAWSAFFDEIVGLYRAEGVDAAMARFNQAMGMGGGSLPPADQLPQHVREMIERMRVNQAFWLDHELAQYPTVQLDLAALLARRDRLVLAGGRQSRDHMPYRAGAILAERLGLSVVDMPGDHVGYVTSPAEFAPALADLLPASRRVTRAAETARRRP